MNIRSANEEKSAVDTQVIKAMPLHCKFMWRDLVARQMSDQNESTAFWQQLYKKIDRIITEEIALGSVPEYHAAMIELATVKANCIAHDRVYGQGR